MYDHRRPRTRSKPAAIAAALAALSAVTGAASTGCRAQASADECKAAADHYVDLAVREVPAHPPFSPSQEAAVRDVERGLKRAEPAFRVVEDRCESIGRAAVWCARDATSTKDWEACLHPEANGAR